MKTLEDVLVVMEARIDRATVEEYIAREWLRPLQDHEVWYFEEIDIARLQLLCHLVQDIEVNNEGMDVVLSLLDQLYGMRSHMRKLAQAVAQQPQHIQSEIMMVTRQVADTNEAP
jgi:chaperone modulatory protein CbpM